MWRRTDAPALNVLIIGATSAIAQETARLFAKERARLFLVGRSHGPLEAVAEDLKVRGGRCVGTFLCDLNELNGHAELVRVASERLGHIDAALVAHGTLPDQIRCEMNVRNTVDEIVTNAIGPISLAMHLAEYFEKQKGGCIAVISSVAGDRGRRSNYVYGCAKGAVSICLAGLRARLQGVGVRVLTIKPGLVDTPMTSKVTKNALFAGPERVGRSIHSAMKRRSGVLYTPWFWRWIMLPELCTARCGRKPRGEKDHLRTPVKIG